MTTENDETLTEIVSSIYNFLNREEDAPCSADTFLNQAIFECLKLIEKENLLKLGSLRASAYYAFKEMVHYNVLAREEPFYSSHLIVEKIKKQWKITLETEEDIIYCNNQPIGTGIIKEGKMVVKIFDSKQINNFKDDRENFDGIFNFSDQQKPSFYLILKNNNLIAKL